MLASWLLEYTDCPDVLVLTLPHALPVAAAVAEALEALLEVFLVWPLLYFTASAARLALGYLASGEVLQLNHDMFETLQLTMTELKQMLVVARGELSRRAAAYHADHIARPISGRTLLLIDDGLTRGAALHVIALALRQVRCSSDRRRTAGRTARDQGGASPRRGGDRPGARGSVRDWYEDLNPPERHGGGRAPDPGRAPGRRPLTRAQRLSLYKCSVGRIRGAPYLGEGGPHEQWAAEP